MKTEKLVQHLADAVRRLGYKVRTEEGNFAGGSCVFAEERIIFLNRRATHEERAELLAKFLSGENLEAMYLLPEVRVFIERFAEDATTGQAESSPPA